jgi:hypothetical protein
MLTMATRPLQGGEVLDHCPQAGFGARRGPGSASPLM